MPVSALTGKGIAEAWQAMKTLFEARNAAGIIGSRRKDQALSAFRRTTNAALLDLLRKDPEIAAVWAGAEAKIIAGQQRPEAAMQQLIDAARSRLK